MFKVYQFNKIWKIKCGVKSHTVNRDRNVFNEFILNQNHSVHVSYIVSNNNFYFDAMEQIYCNFGHNLVTYDLPLKSDQVLINVIQYFHHHERYEFLNTDIFIKSTSGN